MSAGLLLAAWVAAAGFENHLAGELSPYLREHASDPIAWFPWSAATFETARSGSKPVLVMVGHAACHECQVLDRTFLGDPALVATVNSSYVAVKVDRQERPDVEQVLRAVAHLPSGGPSEPLLLVLNPDGSLRPNGTHAGASTRADLKLWLDAARKDQTKDGSSAVAAPSSAQGDGGGERVPPFGLIRLLLAEAAAGDSASQRQLVQRLDAMARGGVRDHVGGGFHHGTRDGTWRVPWFEKLLCDNALLIRSYAQAYPLTRDLVYRDVVKETVAWAIRDLRDPTGAFLTAVSAVSQGREGGFYVWTREELVATLGHDRGAEFLSVYQLEAPGVLQLTGSPFAGLGGSREVLQVRRGRRVRPIVDDKVITGWNGLMIGALATSGSVLRRGSDLEAARRAATSVLSRLGPARALRHYAVGTESRGSATLEDYAFLAEGLLDLHVATAEVRWRDEASALVDAAVTRFWDVGKGGFFATDRQQEPLPLRLKPTQDGPLPAANGVMAAVLLRLGRLTGQERFSHLGRKTLEAFAQDASGGETLTAARRLLSAAQPTH